MTDDTAAREAAQKAFLDALGWNFLTTGGRAALRAALDAYLAALGDRPVLPSEPSEEAVLAFASRLGTPAGLCAAYAVDGLRLEDVVRETLTLLFQDDANPAYLRGMDARQFAAAVRQRLQQRRDAPPIRERLETET